MTIMGGGNGRNKLVLYLAGLLHDIGKLYQRADIEKEMLSGAKPSRFYKRHEVYSVEFVDMHSNLAVFRDIDVDLIKTLIRGHHGDKIPSELVYVDEIDAKERLSEEQEEKAPSPIDIILERLRTPFLRDELNIYREPSPDRHTCLKLKPLSIDEKFWVMTESGSKWEDLRQYLKVFGSYTELKEKFDSFLKKYSSLICNVDTLDYVLRTFLWSVPVAVYSGEAKYIPTLSLYHHSKIVAALSAIRFEVGDKEKGILLIGGDISGIQAFISHVTRVREADISGVAKRLRGRSAFIELLLNAVTLALIEFLGLNTTHIIYMGGGNFFIVAPNTEEIKLRLKAFEQGVERFLMEWLELRGELGFVFDYIETSFLEVTNKAGEVIRRLRERLWRKKRSKFSGLQLADFRDEERWGEICRSCSMRPATKDDRLCDVCRYMQRIGDSIVRTIGKKSSLLYIITRGRINLDLGNLGETLFYVEIHKNFCIYVILIPYLSETPEFFKELFGKFDMDRIHRIYMLAIRDSLGFIPDPNIVPNAIKESQHLQKIVFGWIMINNYVKLSETGGILSFDDLAEMVEEGPKYLAYIKADVDYAGLLFSRLKTLSQFMSLSFILETFFAGFIPNYIRSKYENSYVVFGGGDDLFLIIVWDKASNFLVDLFRFYDELSMGRSTMTSSCNLFRPKFPVRSAYYAMIRSLDEAKPKYHTKKGSLKGGKVFIFDTFVPYSELEKLVDFGEELCNYVKEGKVPRTLLFRIISLIKDMRAQVKVSERNRLRIPVIWWPKLLYTLRKLREKYPEISDKILSFCSDFRSFSIFLVPTTLAFLKTRRE